MTRNASAGFFDLQVNGFAGVDFNADGLTAAQLHRACASLARGGVASILATIITDRLELMQRRLRRLIELRERDELSRRIIAGIHIEGPFINQQAGYRGAHPRAHIRPADVDEMKLLLDAAGGLARIVTLAPECDTRLKVTKLLARSGVRVAAGHCNSTIAQLHGSQDAGLTMFTHLGNGCPMQMHRHDNIIQRVLSLPEPLWVTFVADGAHIPYFALGNYIRLAGMERTIIVTDAVAPAGLGPGRYTLGTQKLLIGRDMTTLTPDGSHFAGSCMTMAKAFANLKKHVGLSDRDARRLTCTNPRLALAFGKQAGMNTDKHR